MGTPPARARTSGALALLLVLALAIGVWLLQGRDPGTSTSVPDDSSSTQTFADVPSDEPSDEPSTGPVEPTEAPPSDPGVDDFSGLPIVFLSDLPPEAQDTVDLIDANGPYPYSQDGGTFGNREGLLPDFEDGYYQEFTVETPGSPDRGARRIIEGADGELYWTDDHYESFSAIYFSGDE